MKDVAYCLSFDEHLEPATHWILLIMIKTNAVFKYFRNKIYI